ncbi:MAG: Hsp20/alpha crystallin family protein [Lachnospiraceae bacterium]|jgi:HSP20 family molecular chaperone IbpA|nr:Hsp20/alpha crystallin family protein [Lachnospiraceae bacterium]
MLYPSLLGEKLFDDFMDFDFPAFRGFEDADRKLYGKHAAQLMKTDVKEHEKAYEVDIDLPGFKKDEIQLNLENGYLTVAAAKGLDKDQQDKKGRIIRKERYAGSMQRSFYIGDGVNTEDVKARFEDGVLKLMIPKNEEKIPEKHTIMIEG